MACTRMPRLAPAAARSRETCTHSSRVGTTTSAWGTPSPPSAGGTTRWSSGTPKPRVLPVPVRAWPMRSLPASARGSVSSWMAKVRVMPTSASAETTSGWTSKSLNSGASSATGAPPSSSTACSSCSGAGAPVSAWSMSTVVGVFSVEVSALASGLLGDRLPGALAPLSHRSRSGVAGSVPAPTRPAETGPHIGVGPGGSPSGRRLQRSSAHRYTSEPKGSPIPSLACAAVSLPPPRCPDPRATRPGQSPTVPPTPGAASGHRRRAGRRRPAGRAVLRRADRLRPAGRGRPPGAHAGRPGGGRSRHAARLTELGADATAAMTPFVPALDAFHDSTRPRTWLEGLVKAYVGDGLASDFYREIAGFLPDPDRALILEVLADTGHADFAVREVRAALATDRTLSGRLALWGRRLVGEAMRQAQAVVAERDQLAELILEGTGDVSGIGRLVERITTAHTERMKTLGLNP